MTTAAFLVGSEYFAAQTVTIDASPESWTAGDYYLTDATGSLSAVDHLVTLMTSAGVTSPDAFIAENRKVRITGGATFTLNWPTDGLLRDFFGFTTNLSGASSYTATNISKYVWGPGTTESPRLGVLGSQGVRAYDAEVSRAPARAIVTINNEWTRNRFEFTLVESERYQSINQLGGEYLEFENKVLIRQRHFKLYRNISDTTAATEMALAGGTLGPYTMVIQDASGLRGSFSRSAGFENTDSFHDVRIDCETRTEYS